eukprot:g4151.t1
MKVVLEQCRLKYLAQTGCDLPVARGFYCGENCPYGNVPSGCSVQFGDRTGCDPGVKKLHYNAKPNVVGGSNMTPVLDPTTTTAAPVATVAPVTGPASCHPNAVRNASGKCVMRLDRRPCTTTTTTTTTTTAPASVIVGQRNGNCAPTVVGGTYSTKAAALVACAANVNCTALRQSGNTWQLRGCGNGVGWCYGYGYPRFSKTWQTERCDTGQGGITHFVRCFGNNC